MLKSIPVVEVKSLSLVDVVKRSGDGGNNGGGSQRKGHLVQSK